METYIVTGAAGFLGCNLTERLMQEEDAHIYAVVRPNSPHNARLVPSEQLTIVPADLSEYARLDEMIEEACDVFFHLAWQGGAMTLRRSTGTSQIRLAHWRRRDALAAGALSARVHRRSTGGRRHSSRRRRVRTPQMPTARQSSLRAHSRVSVPLILG